LKHNWRTSIEINTATTALQRQVRTLGEPAQPERHFRRNFSRTYLTRTLTDPLINGGWLSIVNGGGKCCIEGGGDGDGGGNGFGAVVTNSTMRQHDETVWWDATSRHNFR